jgi:hypothetical protein
MANKVEFQLTSDAAQAMADANKLVDKMAVLTEKYKEANAAAREQKEAGKAFDEVAGAVGKVAAALGLAGGVSAAFNAALGEMEAKAAAINREAAKAMEIGRQVSAGTGNLLQNLPGTTAQEMEQIRADLTQVLLNNPAQGAGAQGMLLNAFTGVRSAVPNLTNAQAMEVANEAAQTRQLDQNLPLADVAAGFGALMGATGLGANDVQNMAQKIQEFGRVTDLSQVLKNTAVIQPAAAAAGASPTDAFALFNFATRTLQDNQGEKSATAVATILKNMSLKAGEIEEATGFRPTGTGMERLEQMVNFVRGGGVDEDTLGKLMPKLAEGVAGSTLMQSLFKTGFAPLQADRDVFKGLAGSGMDTTADKIAQEMAKGGSFALDFQMRSQTALRESALGMDTDKQERAALRQAMRTRLEATETPDKYIEEAETSFDYFIRAGYSPEAAYERTRTAGRLGALPLIGGIGRAARSAVPLVDAARFGRDAEGNIQVPGASESAGDDIAKVTKILSDAVADGMTRGLQNTRQRQPVEGLNQ